MTGKNLMKTVTTVLMLCWMCGCASQPQWVRYELCFGLSADSGRTSITELQWQQFRDTEIAPRFPDGFTLTRAEGYWKNGSTNYSEPSEILLVVAPDTEATRKNLDAITAAYSRRFIQDSVLEIKSPASVDFHHYP